MVDDGQYFGASDFIDNKIEDYQNNKLKKKDKLKFYTSKTAKITFTDDGVSFLSKSMKIEEEQMKFCLFSPKSTIKTNWDLFITLVLFFTCLVTPARLAFVEQDEGVWIYINHFINLMFLIDMIIIFCSSYYDDDMQLV